MKYLAGKELVSKIVTSRPTIIQVQYFQLSISLLPPHLQLIHLRTKDDLNVLCANTHLYFDPAHEEVVSLLLFRCFLISILTLRN